MRFSIIANIALTAASFITGGHAAPHLVGKRDVSTAIDVVNRLNSQVSAASAALQQTFAGLNGSSSADDKSAAAQQAAVAINQLTVAMGEGISNFTSAPAAGQKRQASGGTPGSTADLINAISALATNIDNLLITAISATGNPALIGPAVAIISTLTTLIVSGAAVVVDILPFLSDIGALLSGVGAILSGVGSIIPKA